MALRALSALLGLLQLTRASAQPVLRDAQYQAVANPYQAATSDGWRDVPEDQDRGSTWLQNVLASASESSPGLSRSGLTQEKMTAATTTSTTTAVVEEQQSEQLGGSTQLLAAAIRGGVPQEVKAASDSGIQILEGMLKTFLHRGELTERERSCLESEMKDAGKVAYNTSKDIAHLVSEIMLPLGQKMNSMDSVDVEAKAVVSTELTSLDMLALIPKLSQRMQKLVESFDGFVQNCHADAMKDALLKVRRHMGSLQYVAGHLQANSADVLKELERASGDFLKEDYQSFGQELGSICRKVLLSGDDASLPEGPPSPKEMANLSTGVLEGFFGRGFELDLSGNYFPDEPLETLLDEDEPEIAVDRSKRLKLRLDVHRCIEKDKAYFEALIAGVYMLFSRMDSGVLSPSQMLALPELMMSGLEGLPRALKRCGLGPDPGEMLLDALQAAASDHLRLNVTAPSQAADKEEPVSQLADHAAKDWQRLDYFHLGEDMGKMMREVVVQGFPQLYSVDDLSGRLLRRHPGGLQAGFATLLLAPTLLLALVAIRCRRDSTTASSHPEYSEVDDSAA